MVRKAICLLVMLSVFAVVSGQGTRKVWSLDESGGRVDSLFVVGTDTVYSESFISTEVMSLQYAGKDTSGSDSLSVGLYLQYKPDDELEPRSSEWETLRTIAADVTDTTALATFHLTDYAMPPGNDFRYMLIGSAVNCKLGGSWLMLKQMNYWNPRH